jgi:hypothetical protein
MSLKRRVLGSSSRAGFTHEEFRQFSSRTDFSGQEKSPIEQRQGDHDDGDGYYG